MSNTSKAAAATLALLISAAPADAQPFELGGFYAGVHVGVVDLEADFDGGNIDDTGSFGGFQAGYNFMRGNLMWGIETDFSLGDANPDGTCPFNGALNCEISVGPIATLRPRVGYATGNWLLYATGGIAGARVSVESNGAFGQVDDVEDGVLGWTAGAGVEYLVSKDVGVKLEYRYMQFGGFDYDPFLGPDNVDVDFKMNSVQAGVNLHF
jgi:outer membrane immunogenic protein